MSDGPYKWDKGRLIGPHGAVAVRVGSDYLNAAGAWTGVWFDAALLSVANNAHAAALASLASAGAVDLTAFDALGS